MSYVRSPNKTVGLVTSIAFSDKESKPEIRATSTPTLRALRNITGEREEKKMIERNDNRMSKSTPMDEELGERREAGRREAHRYAL
jgi:hypothetical protein